MVFNVSKKIFKVSLLGLIFFVLDRVLRYLSLADKIFFHKNPGMALSINVPEKLTAVFYIFIFIVLIIFIGLMFKALNKNKILEFGGHVLIILGASSNLIDRLKFGYVVDYLNFYFFYNNLADIMIIVGVALLIFSMLKKPEELE